MSQPNLEHDAIVEKGPNWVRFKSRGPDTLDEIAPEGVYFDRIINEGNGIWYLQFEKDFNDQ